MSQRSEIRDQTSKGEEGASAKRINRLISNFELQRPEVSQIFGIKGGEKRGSRKIERTKLADVTPDKINGTN